jgi:DNA end-binding protein Ku
MRSMWSGHLGFGLVQVPVKLFKASESHDIGFHQHHGPECHGRIQMLRSCKDCGAVVDYGDLMKGIEVEGTTVILTGDELADLADEQGKQIEITKFVDATEIDPIMYENSYYIGAPNGERAYALLREAMSESGLLAIARVMLRSKTQRCAIRVVDDHLVLHTLLWPDELREADVPGLDGKVKPAELKAARMLVESMVGAFDQDEDRDEYTERLRELIDAKASDQEFITHAAPEEADLGEVEDLLAQLEASVARHPAGKKKAPAAKKAPAKRAAPKRRRNVA